ncbi:Os05g0280350, partial [Oryza sativa Japonica Group]
MNQIRLITDHHDNNARVGMVAELTKPPVDIVEALPLCDVVNKESPNSATVVSTCDGTISLLSCCVPDLSLYSGGDLQGFGGELDADGGLGVEGEVVAGEAGEDIRLADAAVADQHHLEQVRVLVIHPPAHLASPPPGTASEIFLLADGVAEKKTRKG